MHAYLHINSLSFDLIIHRFISLRKISKITNKIFTLYKYSEKKLHLIFMGAINRIWIKSLPIFPKFTEYSIYQKAKLNRFFDTDTTYGENLPPWGKIFPPLRGLILKITRNFSLFFESNVEKMKKCIFITIQRIRKWSRWSPWSKMLYVWYPKETRMSIKHTYRALGELHEVIKSQEKLFFVVNM